MLNNKNVFSIFTDRHGGVSHSPYDSLNLAYHVGDTQINVDANRKLLTQKTAIKDIAYMEQIHTDNVSVVKRAGLVKNCDALITNKKGLGLMVMVADCIPILMHDPVKEVIAVVHAGRNGTFLGIAKKCVNTMITRFNVNPKDLQVSFGPSIGSCCYEVGDELVGIMKKNFGQQYIKKENHLDLQSLNRDILKETGITNIQISQICTCCNNDYFSYRREGISGRSVGVIALK